MFHNVLYILTILILLTASGARGATYYVTSAGSGAANGSSYSNSMSWAAFLTGATGGNTYYLSGAFSVTLAGTLTNNGSAGHYIIIDGNDGVNPAATITMTTGVNNGAIYLNGKSYIEVCNISFAGTTNDVGDAPIKCNDSSYILVHDNTINGSFHRGIFFVGTSNSSIYNNSVTSTRTASQPDGIKIKDGSHDVSIYGNTIYDWAHTGLECWGTTASKVYNISIYDNEFYLEDRGYGRAFDVTTSDDSGDTHHIYIYNNYIHGMRARSHAAQTASYVYIHDNVFYDTKNCCLNASDTGCSEAGTYDGECTAGSTYQNGQHLDINESYGESNHVYIYNNTFYSSSEEAIWILNDVATFDNIHILYNIIYNSANAAVSSSSPVGSVSIRYDTTAMGIDDITHFSNSTIKHNVIYSTTRTTSEKLVAGNGFGYTIAQAEAAHAWIDDNYLRIPDLVSPENGIFIPKVGSGVINISSDSGYSTTDLAGRTRPIDTLADAGAFEYTPSPYSWYFSESEGSDFAAGTTDMPFKSLMQVQDLLDSLTSSDTATFYFKRGDTWTITQAHRQMNNSTRITLAEYPTGWTPYRDGVLWIDATGTVTIDAYGSTSLAKPIFDGGETWGPTCPYSISGRNATDSIIALYYASNITIQNIHIRNCFASAIAMTGTATNITVQNCFGQYIGKVFVSADASGTSKTNIIIQDNETSDTEHNWYTYNSNTTAPGVYPSPLVKFPGGVAWGGVVHLQGGDEAGPYCPVYGAIVRRNIFRRAGGEGIIVGSYEHATLTNVIEDNVVADTGHVSLHIPCTAGDSGTLILRRNLVYTADGVTDPGYDSYGIAIFDECDNATCFAYEAANGVGDNSLAKFYIYGNVIINRTYGMWIQPAGDEYGEIQIFNNTFIDCDYSLRLQPRVAVTNMDIFNNSFLYLGKTGNHLTINSDVVGLSDWNWGPNHWYGGTLPGSPYYVP